jgi:hypothetical protein
MHGTKREEAGVKRPLGGSARRLSLVLSVALGLGLISATVTTPARAQVPPSVTKPIRLAEAALAQTKVHVARRQFGRANMSLKSLRENVARAHKAGMAQIGKPPSDPESDDPPGPPSVIAVLNMEHHVGIGLVPLFNRMREAAVVNALQDTLIFTYDARDKMLDRVIALPPEGAGSDYSDSMSDTLPIYSVEVNQITDGLKQYQLIQPGRTALTTDLRRVRATQAKVNKEWGGGE